MVLNAIYILGAIVAVVCGVRYFQLRRLALPAYEALIKSKGEEVKPAATLYWGLDRLAKRTALVGLAAYAVTILANVFAGTATEPDPLRWIAVGLVSLFVVSMSIIATIYNDKESTVRMNRGGYY